MSDVPNPNSKPASSPSPPPTGPEPKCALLAMCTGPGEPRPEGGNSVCGDGIELALPLDQRMFSLALAQRGWFISVLSPPGQGIASPMVLGPLCTACAQLVYPPEVFAAAEQRRQQLLQHAAQAAQVPR